MRYPPRFFLRPPEFQDDEEKTNRSRWLNLILLVDILVMTVMLLGSLAGGGNPWLVNALLLLTVVVLFGLRGLLFRGYVNLVGNLNIFLFTLLLTAVLYVKGTVLTPAFSGFIIIVMTAGVLLTRRAMLLATLANMAAALGLLWAEQTGRMGPAEFGISITQWLNMAAFLIYTGVFTYWNQRNITTALRSTRRELTERRQLEKQLEESRIELERQVAEQTAELRAANELLRREVTERRQAEEELRRSKREADAFMKATPGIVYMFDDQGHIVQWNPNFEELLGYSSEEIGAIHALDTIYEPDREMLVEKVMEVLREGKSSTEVRMQARDGRVIPLLVTGARVVMEDGKQFVVGVGLDLSRRIAAEQELRRSQEQLRAMLDATSEDAFLISPDGDFLAVNEAFLRSMKSTAEALLHTNGFEMLPPEVATTRRQFFDQVIQTGKPVRFEDYGLNGWSDNTIYPVLSPEGKVEALSIFSRDINEQKRYEQALRKSEERYKLAAEGANDGLWDYDILAGEIYFSPRWKAMLGFADSDISSQPDEWWNRIHPDDRELVRVQLLAHIEGRFPQFEAEHRVLHRDGKYRWMQARGLAVRNETNQLYRIAGSLTDITVRKQIEERLLYDALHDVLTGLPNRTLLSDRLEQALRLQKRHNETKFAVLFIDLDRFKEINDSQGHSAGDQLLVSVVQRIGSCLRPTDTLARLGGDEFVILLQDIEQPEEPMRIADQIQALLAPPFDLDGLPVHSSASIGILLGDQGYERAEEILRNADIAMYRAKAMGRARYQVFDSSMHAEVLAHTRLEVELRQALAQGELEVHYQPIYSLSDASLKGFEALARWRHPQRGLIQPAEFIPLAEETHLIIPLDRWVLTEACRQVQAWQLAFDCPLALNVNLSSMQVAQPDTLDFIRQTLHDTGFPASSLHIEITESAIMDNLELARQVLRQLCAAGVRVEIDDFGTGFSSLTYLGHLPVNTIKIDRGFVREMSADRAKAEIVQAVVGLAHKIGMDVVAEGIETPEQEARLKEMGCDFGQGFLFARPACPVQTQALIQKLLARSESKRG